MLDEVSKKLYKEAERVLTSILLNDANLHTTELADVFNNLTPEHFSDKSLSVIYRACTQAYQETGKINPANIIEILTKTNSNVLPHWDSILNSCNLERTKNVNYSLLDSPSLAKIIRDFSNREKLSNLIGQANQTLGDITKGKNALTIAENLNSITSDIIANTISEGITDVETEYDLLLNNITTRSNNPVIPTPLQELNLLLSGGLRKGELFVIAARPGCGKSTLALEFARVAAFDHNKVTYCKSLEMTAEELTEKIISSTLLIPLKEIKKGLSETSEHYQKMEQARPFLKEKGRNIIIDDSANTTLASFLSEARKIKHKYGERLGLIIVDYIQLMTCPQHGQSRHDEVSAITRALKQAAKELDVPIVALSQLNRESEKNRKDTRPRLDNLRSSGSIEQDANQVLLLWKIPAKTMEEDDEMSDECAMFKALLDKNRGGETGIIELEPCFQVSCFKEIRKRPQYVPPEY